MAASFVFTHPIVSGKSVEEAKVIFKTTFPSIMLRGWMVSGCLLGNMLIMYTDDR